MTKVIRIGSEPFILPEGMTTKDIQTLAGVVLTLKTVINVYNYDTSDYMQYAGNGVEVRLEEVELLTKEEAEAKSKASRKAYEDKKAAEQQ